MNLPIWGEQARQTLKLDCSHYRGDRPCAAGVQGICPTDCAHHTPMGHRILIIKLAALGDVIRTAALLPGLKQAWPQSQITWVSRPNGVRMLQNHPLIDRLLPFDAETLCHLDHERFDLCLSLDKEPAPAALAMRIDAPDKRGMGLSPHGTVYPLNAACAPYFELGLTDELKFFHNQKSYPRLIYEALGLTYEGQSYTLYPSAADRASAARCWQDLGVHGHDIVIGLNTGAGRVFANKNWPPAKFIDLCRAIQQRHPWRIALLGGPDEHALNEQIAAACPGTIHTGGHHRELAFAALVERCQVVVTGDTMAMHVAIARNVPCVALFGPTCHQEIDLQDRGDKIVTSLPCSPCYLRHCEKSPNCMDDIAVGRVMEAIEKWVATAAPGQGPPAMIEVGA